MTEQQATIEVGDYIEIKVPMPPFFDAGDIKEIRGFGTDHQGAYCFVVVCDSVAKCKSIERDFGIDMEGRFPVVTIPVDSINKGHVAAYDLDSIDLTKLI